MGFTLYGSIILISLKGWSTWERGVRISGGRARGWGTWKGLENLGAGRLKYLGERGRVPGEGGWSTWEKCVRVPGRGS